MMSRTATWFVTLAVISAFAVSGAAFAEHPSAVEHPAQKPAEMTKSAGVTKEDLATAIEGYVKMETELKGGYFLVYDKLAEKPLMLTLQRVHQERLARVGPDKYFACADFATPEGKVYDLDIFMKGPDKDHLTVTKVTIHKEEGKERYTWHEEGGVWKMKPMAGVEKGQEHPTEKAGEHPMEKPAEHPHTGSETK